jgi:hypothetical protein
MNIIIMTIAVIIHLPACSKEATQYVYRVVPVLVGGNLTKWPFGLIHTASMNAANA